MMARSRSAVVFAALLIVAATVSTIPALAATPNSDSTQNAAATSLEPAIPSPDSTVATHGASNSPNANNSPPATNPVAATYPAATNPVAGNSFGLASGMIFLVAMVLVAAWLVKRSGGMPSWRSGGSMKVVAALPVGPRERVLLVEVGGQQWLLGVTPNAINNLHHFEQPIISAASGDEFSNRLRQFLPQGFGK